MNPPSEPDPQQPGGEDSEIPGWVQSEDDYNQWWQMQCDEQAISEWERRQSQDSASAQSTNNNMNTNYSPPARGTTNSTIPLNQLTQASPLQEDIEDEEGLIEPHGPVDGKDGGVSDAQKHYVASGNNKKVLVCMAQGLSSPSGEEIADLNCPILFSTLGNKKLSNHLPRKQDLVDERKRRLTIMASQGLCGKEKKNLNTKSDYLTWLRMNPVMTSASVQFIQREIKNLRQVKADAASARVREVRERGGKQWSGLAPYLRLIHSLVDFEDIREAYVLSFNQLTRKEIDARNNSDERRAPVNVWRLIADKFNDRSFNPESQLMGSVWHEFGSKIDLSYDAVVVKMGELPEQKEKDKLTSLRAKLNICICDHKASGNGDGTRTFGSCDETETPEMLCDDRSNYVRAGTTPAILYLWNLARENGILHSVTQRITDGHSFDGGKAPSVMGKKNKKRKKKGGEDTQMVDFQNFLGVRLDDASYQMATSNLFALREKLDALEGNVLDQEEQIALLEMEMEEKGNERIETRLGFRRKRIQKDMEKIKIVENDIKKILDTMNRIDKGRKQVGSGSQSAGVEEEAVVIEEDEKDENEKSNEGTGSNNDSSDDESSEESSADDEEDE
jgi:hypothetical protein